MDLNIIRDNIEDFEKINKLFWQSDYFYYINEPYIMVNNTPLA